MQVHRSFVFFGTGEFAQAVLRKFIEINRLPILVVTAPDKRAGRGLKLRPRPIKLMAEEVGIKVLQPESLEDKGFLSKIRNLQPDFMVVTDYGKIIPPNLLRWPKLAPLNIHPSLLPKFRGAAPIERAMMACERTLGVTVIIMDEGIDTGDILLQSTVEIGETETKGEVEQRLADVGFRLIIRAMDEFEDLTPRPQSSEGASYAKKIRKDELWIDWASDAKSIACKINALSPTPCARTYFDDRYVKLFRAVAVQTDAKAEPGSIEIQKDRLFVAANNGLVEILELQPEGKRRMKASEFLRGYCPRKASSSKPSV